MLVNVKEIDLLAKISNGIPNLERYTKLLLFKRQARFLHFPAELSLIKFDKTMV